MMGTIQTNLTFHELSNKNTTNYYGYWCAPDVNREDQIFFMLHLSSQQTVSCMQQVIGIKASSIYSVISLNSCSLVL